MTIQRYYNDHNIFSHLYPFLGRWRVLLLGIISSLYILNFHLNKSVASEIYFLRFRLVSKLSILCDNSWQLSHWVEIHINYKIISDIRMTIIPFNLFSPAQSQRQKNLDPEQKSYKVLTKAPSPFITTKMRNHTKMLSVYW